MAEERPLEEVLGLPLGTDDLEKGYQAFEKTVDKAIKERELQEKKLKQERIDTDIKNISDEFFAQEKLKDLSKEDIQKIKGIAEEKIITGGSDFTQRKIIAPVLDLLTPSEGKMTFKRRNDLAKEYQDFFNKKQKERISALTPEELDDEIKSGGIYNNKAFLNSKLFGEKFLDHYTFGVIKPSEEIRNYGKRLEELNPITSTTAAIAGELAGFMTVYGVASPIAVPAISKVTELKRGGFVAEAIVRGLGYIPNKAKNIKNLYSGIDTSIKSAGALEMGAATTTSMILNGAIDTSKALTGKYLRDNEETKAAWEGTLNHTSEGILRGYGISVINAPQNMAMRVIGDMAFSVGQQGYSILMKRQKDWSYQQLAQDAAVNLLIGEGVIQKFYSMTKTTLEKRVAKSDNAKYFYNLMNQDELFANYSPGKKAMAMEEMVSTAQEIQSRNPIALNDAVRKNIFDIHKVKEEKFMSDLRDKLSHGHFYDMTKEAIENDIKTPIRDVMDEFSEIGFKVPETYDEGRKILSSRENFKSFLKENGVDIVTSDAAPELPPININEFKKIFYDIVDRKADAKTGTLPGTQLSREAVDVLFKGPEELIRVIPTKEGVVTSVSPAETLLSTKEDIELLQSILAKELIPYSKDRVSMIYEWLDDPNNFAKIRGLYKTNKEAALTVASRESSFDQDLNIIPAYASKKGKRREDLINQPAAPIKEESKIDIEELRDLALYMSQDDANIINSIPFFMKKYLGNPTEERISIAMKSLGVDVPESRIKMMIDDTNAGLKAMNKSINPEDPVVNMILDTYGYPVNKIMTEGNLDLLYRSKINKIADSDEMVAIPKTIPTYYRKLINEEGAFILDLEDIERKMLDSAGKMTADRVIAGIKNIINENTASFNKRSSTKGSEGTVRRINLFSPEKTKIVIVGENIGYDKASAFAKDMYNLIRGSYEGNYNNYRRSFIFKIPQIGAAAKVNGFKDLKLAEAGSFEDVNSYSYLKSLVLAKILPHNPRSWVFRNDVSFMLDMTDKSFKAIKSGISDEDFLRLVQGSQMFQTVPEVFSPLASKNEKEKGGEMLGLNEEQLKASGYGDELSIKPLNIGSSDEWKYGEFYRDLTGKEVSTIDMINAYDVPLAAKQTVDNQVFNKIGKAIADSEDNFAKSKGLMGIIMQPFKTASKGISDFTSERFDIYSDNPDHLLIKTVAQGTFADKHSLPEDVNKFMMRAYEDVIQSLIPKNLPVARKEKVLNAVASIHHFAREVELKKLLNPDGTLKPDVRSKLAEPIKWSSGKDDSFLNDWSDAPEKMTPAVLRQFGKDTADDFAYIKLAINLFGVKADDYIRFAMRDNEVFTKLIQPLWLMSGSRKGAYLNLNDMTRFQKVVEETLYAKVKYHRPDLVEKYGDEFYSGTPLFKAVESLADRPFGQGSLFDGVPNGDKELGNFNTRLDHYKNTDFANLSYVFHSVLADQQNKKVFNNIIAKYSGALPVKLIDPNDPESGRAVTDEQIPGMDKDAEDIAYDLSNKKNISNSEMGVMIDAMLGRTNPTTAQLIDLGFTVDINHFNNVNSQIRYLFAKEYNFQVGAAMKDRYTRRMMDNYKPVAELKASIDNVLKSRVKGVRQLDKLNTIKEYIDKEKAARAMLLRSIGESGGYIYIPTPNEISNVSFQLNSLQKQYDEFPVDTESKVINNLQRNIESLKVTKANMEFLVKLYNGEDVAESYDKIIAWMKSSRNREKRKIEENKNLPEDKQLPVDQSVIDFASSRNIKKIESERDIAIKLYEQDLVYNMYGTADPKDIKWNPLMPIDAKSHNHKEFFINEIDKTTGRPKREILNSAFSTEIRRSFVGLLPYEIKSASSAPGFEGIYMQRSNMETFRQFLFRSSMTPQKQEYSGLDWVRQFYDNSNAWMKRISLWQPQIMFWNNAAQSVFASNPFSVNTAKGFMESARILKLKKDIGSEEQQKYHKFDQANLFNKSVGFPEMMDDATQTTMDYLLRNDKLGLTKYLEVLNKKSGLSAEAAELKAQKQYAKLALNWANRASNAASIPLRYVQEITWAGDEYMRLSMAIPMQKRFHSYYRDKYRKSGMANWEEQADIDSYRRASDYVNDMMVEYSRIPGHTRKSLNRIFMYPTYRIGTFRLYKNMFTDFTKGVKRAFGYNPDNKYMVSDNRYEQAMFEVGPMFRWISAIAATKVLAVALFGGDYFDDEAFDYRVRRDEGGDGLGQKIGILSFGTPLFDMHKIITRDFSQTIKYNQAAWPRLVQAVYLNQHPVTGRSLYTADYKKDPALFSAQLGASLVEWHTPFMPDWRSWRDEDKGLALRVIETSGLGFYYNADDPGQARRDFVTAINKSKSPEERNAAYNQFKKRMKHIRNQWQTRREKEIDKLRSAETGVGLDD